MLPPDARPVFAHVTGNQVTVLWQGKRHGERAVAGEGADLEGVLRADQLDQEGEEMPLLRRDLHVRGRHLAGQLAQLGEHRVFGRMIVGEITVEAIVEPDRSTRHAARSFNENTRDPPNTLCRPGETESGRPAGTVTADRHGGVAPRLEPLSGKCLRAGKSPAEVHATMTAPV